MIAALESFILRLHGFFIENACSPTGSNLLSGTLHFVDSKPHLRTYHLGQIFHHLDCLTS